jgi:hypothetical protein
MKAAPLFFLFFFSMPPPEGLSTKTRRPVTERSAMHKLLEINLTAGNNLFTHE